MLWKQICWYCNSHRILRDYDNGDRGTIMKKPGETQNNVIHKKFTDRDEPKRLFWEWYEKANKNRDDFFVLSFYGIGGIGKSCLVDELCRELQKKEVFFIKYDFERTAVLDTYSILVSIKQSIRNRYKDVFRFPLFNAALAIMSTKGDTIFENDEYVKSAISEFPILQNITDGVGAIPIVGTPVEKGILIIDRVLSGIENFDISQGLKKKYKDIIREMESLEVDELCAKMPQYFQYDMIENTRSLLKPFVIFLDTYEKYIDTFKSVSNVSRDRWLRKSTRSLIQRIPGILWVISGRDMLDWKKNGEWDDYHLKCQNISEFMPSDSIDYLEEAGITERKLAVHIHKITEGVPGYLDICVDTYSLLKDSDVEPTVDNFDVDKSEIVGVYAKYLDNNNRRLMNMLAAMGSWNDDEAKWVGDHVSFMSFSAEMYNAMMRHSFITAEKDKKKMHKIVADALKSEMEESTVNEVNKFLFQYRISKSGDTNEQF